MVRRPLPRAGWLQHLVSREMPGKFRGCPHMVEPAAAVVLGPVGRAVAPPGETTFRCGHEPAADVDPAMRLLQIAQRFDFDGGVADDAQQRPMKSSLCPNLEFCSRSGMSPPAGT